MDTQFVTLDSLTAGALEGLPSLYIELMRQLHGEYFDPTAAEVHRLAPERAEIIGLLFYEWRLVATAQASHSQVLPVPKVFIQNVVVDQHYRGNGLGRKVLTLLMAEAKLRWAPAGLLQAELTNSPRKGNAWFYEALGFAARTEKNDDPTVVWVKTL